MDDLVYCDFARLELLVFNEEAGQKAAEPRPSRALLSKATDILSDGKRRRSLMFNLYERMDRRKRVPSVDPLAPVDCTTRFQDIESISVMPITKRFAHRFPTEALERIRAKELDVLLRFGFNILRGEILTSARYGVWSYHHGDNDRYRGGPAYFWELYEGNPLSGAVLQVLTEELDAGKVLYKGLFATHPGFSQTLNRIQPYWGAISFPIQKLRELHQYGWDHIEKTSVPRAPYLGRKRIYTTPSNWEMVRWMGPLMIRKAASRLVRRPVVKHWRLAARVGARAISDSARPDMGGFRWIESPKGRYYADPFLVELEGTQWLFFEDFDYATRRGRISCVEVRGGAIANPAVALERPYHLSYPCVFRDGDTWYMMPETSANGTVELYRCARFPDLWELEKELFRARAVDTTVLMQEGRYWFFVTLRAPHGDGTQLWLFHADSLTGDWTAHPASPLSTDVRNSRGAGAIFRRNGTLFRPSQDCSRDYGYSFTLNEVVTLNPREYLEKPGPTVGPSWSRGLIGTHTYSQIGDLEVIDGCAPLPRSRVLARS